MVLKLHAKRTVCGPGHQLLEDPHQRAGGPLEGDDLPGELVNPAGDLWVRTKKVILDFVNIVLQAGRHGLVLIHHLVQDAVQYGVGAQGQELRHGLHPAPDLGQVRRLGVPHGDHVLVTHEDVDFAEVHLFHIVAVPGRPEHQEQALAVVLQLGPLVPCQRVLNGQRVKVEFLAHRLQFLRIRPVQSDPRHAFALPEQEVGLVQVLRVLGAESVDVNSVVNDGHCRPPARAPSHPAAPASAS